MAMVADRFHTGMLSPDSSRRGQLTTGRLEMGTEEEEHKTHIPHGQEVCGPGRGLFRIRGENGAAWSKAELKHFTRDRELPPRGC